MRKKRWTLPFNLKDSAVFHCGPLIKYIDKREWKAISVGATSSSRFSPFVASLISNFESRIVVGKGNLFKEAVDSIIKHKAVFLLAIGGCAALYGSRKKES